jgi:hypothetical protein
MKKFNFGAIVALLALSLALGACVADQYAYRDGHGNHGSDFVD